MKCCALEKKVGRTQDWSNSSVRPIGRQIQIRWLFAASFVLALLSAVPAYGQRYSVAPKCERQCLKTPATTDQLRAHPWMIDESLPARVAAYSQVLGQLLGQERKLLKLGWCINFRQGEDFAVRDDESTEYKWELIPRNGDIDEYRVKRTNDGKEEKIILLKTQWIILGGDAFDDLTAQGDITGVKAPQ
jgi:hypothetical protein